MRASPVLAVIGFLWTLQIAGTTQAGPVEQFVQLAVHPADENVMALRYAFGGEGVLYSTDAGATFKLVCASAIDRELRGVGTMAMAGDGHVLLGESGGLHEDTGGGCGWSKEPTLNGLWVTDFTGHPSDPGVLFLSTGETEGGIPALNGIVRRGPGGVYERFGVQEALLVWRLRVAETQTGLRFYESLLDGMVEATIDGVTTQAQNFLLRVSDDDAETFQEFPHPLPTGEGFRLLEVDPSNPDRIVALIERATALDDDVLVSSDRGETFTVYLTLPRFGAIELAPDGRVFIGSGGLPNEPDAEGLWSAQSLDAVPEKVADYPVNCLHYRESSDTLFVCQRFWVGIADPSDGTFTRTVSFADVEGLVSCNGVDMAAACETQLCGDYCGYRHFAQAPLCEAYDGPHCGPCVAAMEDTSLPPCDSNTGVPDGGLPPGPSSGGAESSAGAPAIAGQGGLGSMAAAGAGAAGQRNGDGDDGCSCSAIGGPASGRFRWLSLVSIWLLASFWRRQR